MLSKVAHFKEGSSSGNNYLNSTVIHPVESYADRTNLSGEGAGNEDDSAKPNKNDTVTNTYLNDEDENDSLVVSYPEKNWKVLLGSFFGISASWGLFFICGTFQDYYSKNQLKEYTSFQISWIFSLYYFLIVSGNLLTGLYFDFHGFQKFLALLLIPGYVLLPFVETFWQILCVFVLMGLGGGLMIPPILGCISDNFYEKRNFANSIAMTGGNIVGIIFPIILEKGFSNLGYRNTSFIICGLFLLQLTLCLCLCSDRKELRRKLKPDEKFLSLYFKESFDYTSLFTNLKFILVTFGIAAAEVSTAVLLVYIASYCSSILNFSDSDSFKMITILNIGTLCGGCFFGIFLAEKIGKVNSVITASFNLLVLNLVLWLWLSPKVPKLMYAFSIFWGINYGGFMSLCPSICGLVSNYYDFGKKYSTVYFVVGVGFLAGIPVSGIIIGPAHKANFSYFIIYCSIIMFLSFLCFLILKFIYIKRNITYKRSERQLTTLKSIVENDIIQELDTNFSKIELTNANNDKDLKLSFSNIVWSKY